MVNYSLQPQLWIMWNSNSAQNEVSLRKENVTLIRLKYTLYILSIRYIVISYFMYEFNICSVVKTSYNSDGRAEDTWQ
jgi:hypothetical protein